MNKRTKKKRSKKRKRNRKTKKFLKSKCSPKTDIDSLKFTCFTKRGLHKIKNIWNKKTTNERSLQNT